VLATLVEPAFDSKTRKKGLLGRESSPTTMHSSLHRAVPSIPSSCACQSTWSSCPETGPSPRHARGVGPWRIAGSLKAYAVIEAADGFVDRHELLPGEALKLREIPHRRRAADELSAPAPAHAITPGAESGRRLTSQRRVSLADIIAARHRSSGLRALLSSKSFARPCSRGARRMTFASPN